MHNSPSILVIGTNPKLVGLRRALELAGHWVDAARSDRRGFKKLFRSHYELVIIDAEMNQNAVEILQQYCTSLLQQITLVRISRHPAAKVETLTLGWGAPYTTKFLFDSIRYFTPPPTADYPYNCFRPLGISRTAESRKVS